MRLNNRGKFHVRSSYRPPNVIYMTKGLILIKSASFKNLSKIVEREAFDQLLEFLDVNELFDSREASHNPNTVWLLESFLLHLSSAITTKTSYLLFIQLYYALTAVSPLSWLTLFSNKSAFNLTYKHLNTRGHNLILPFNTVLRLWLDGCIYARVIRLFSDFDLTRSRQVDVIDMMADNLCL